MTDFSADSYTTPDLTSSATSSHGADSFNADTGGTASITWYTMRAVDANAGTTPPTYRTWTVQDEPDWDASQYNGPYSGGSPNLTSVTVKSTFTS